MWEKILNADRTKNKEKLKILKHTHFLENKARRIKKIQIFIIASKH